MKATSEERQATAADETTGLNRVSPAKLVSLFGQEILQDAPLFIRRILETREKALHQGL
jgi:hypothetical protein